MKNVFLTGATGIMGMETVKAILKHPEELALTVLVRPSEANKAKLEPYAQNLNIVWGDLNDHDLISDSMKDMDYVLHVGAIIPPAANSLDPKEVMSINYGSTLAMLRGIKKFGQEEKTHFVYIGTVEEVGHRAVPMHWGRVGDPLQPPIYCYYAVSKTASERAVAESGLKYWASVRQSFQHPNAPIGAEHPIIAMQPEANCAEHIDSVSSGNLMLQICLNAPEKFWGSAYNLGGGEGFRFNYYNYVKKLHGSSRSGFEPKWLAKYNFHGHFFLDSDKLQELIPYRLKTGKQFFEWEMKNVIKVAKTKPRLTPEETLEKNRSICSMSGGTIDVINKNDEEAIKVYWGSREAYNAIPDTWDEVPAPGPIPEPVLMDHGYDETKPVAELDIEDMKQAAAFRGGICLSENMEKGAMYTPLEWECAFGHKFIARPNTVLKMGHWCPKCMEGKWDYFTQAKVNPFFAQSWDYLHKEEPFVVEMKADASDIDAMFE